MANNTKKNDPTEAALSAIQEALEVRAPEPFQKTEPPAPASPQPELVADVRREPESRRPAPRPTTVERPRNGNGAQADRRDGLMAEDGELFGDQPARTPRSDEPSRRPAANDDRHSIGQVLQAVQRRPSRMSYTLATIFSAAWIVAGAGLAYLYVPQFQALIAQAGSVAVPMLLGIGALFLAPVFFFYALAHMVSRSHELRMIAQSMAEVAIRLAEPETVARESIVSVGQAIRREVAAMGDGVERALARAAELEALVHNEVSALERAYNDNEVRIRGMLQDLASQRDTLVTQAEQVRNAITSVHLDLSQDITSVSDLVAERVSETAQRITHTLADKGEHITLALGRAGDSMITALTERGSDMLERLEQTSDQTTHAINTATERMSASLNFKTDNIHAEFAGLANNLKQIVSSQFDDVARDFEQRSTAVADLIGGRTRQMTDSIIDNSALIADTIASRVEEANSTLKATGDSFVIDLSLRGGDVISNLEQTGRTIAETMVNRGGEVVSSLEHTGRTIDEALVNRSSSVNETFRASGEELSRLVDGKGEAVKNMLAARMLAFEEMFTHGGAELGEKITRESTTLGNLITRHLSEFDRTVKIYGGDLVDRLGKRSEEVAQALDERTQAFDMSISGRISGVSSMIDARIAEITSVIDSRGLGVAQTLVGKIEDIDNILGSRALEVAGNLDMRIQRIEDLNATVKESSGDAERTLTDLSANISSTLKQNAEDVERTLLSVSSEVARSFTGKADEIAAAVTARANEMTNVLDQSSSGLLSALTNKSEEFASQVGRATEHALSEIDTKGYAFAQSLADQGADITRGITEASVNATLSVTRTLQELQEASQAAIEQSKQTATSTVSEMLETHGMLRSDTTTLFERLREANILLQEVLSGAHENMSSLENTLVNRVSEFVTSMNEVSEKSGAATATVDRQIGEFHNVTARVLGDLGQLATQFQSHGRGLAEAVDLIDRSNRRTEDVLAERRTGLDSLVATLDIRTEDLEQRLKHFTRLLDETLDTAAERAREIAHIVSDASAGGTQAITEQFDRVRSTVEQERVRTAEAMRGIYEDARNDTGAIFRQSTERFTEVIHGMKHMASEMQRELETTRGELRRGILELPQETAESAAQMRRVIVDQIEALAELNRIVARHGRGLDAAEPARRAASGGSREDSMTGGFERERIDVPRERERMEVPRERERIEPPRQATRRDPPSVSLTSSSTPAPAPARRAEAPSLSPAAAGANRPTGWLSDLLQRASRDDEPAMDLPREPASRESAPRDERNARHSIELLDSLSVDIARMIDHEAATELWDKYKRGERNVFTRRLYTLQGQKAFDDISKKYRSDREFRQTVDRYITEFERLLDEVSRDDRGQVVARTYLTSETGKVYTMLAHAAGRFE